MKKELEKEFIEEIRTHCDVWLGEEDKPVLEQHLTSDIDHVLTCMEHAYIQGKRDNLEAFTLYVLENEEHLSGFNWSDFSDLIELFEKNYKFD